MTTIRKELAKDIAAREALLDRAFGDARFHKAAERLREGRMPAHELSFVAQDKTASSALSGSGTSRPGRRGRHCCSGPLAGRRRVARPRDRRSFDAARHRGRAAARSQGGAAGGRCTLLRAFRLLGEKTGALWMPGPYEKSPPARPRTRARALSGAHGLINATGERLLVPDLHKLIAGLSRNALAPRAA